MVGNAAVSWDNTMRSDEFERRNVLRALCDHINARFRRRDRKVLMQKLRSTLVQRHLYVEDTFRPCMMSA